MTCPKPFTSLVANFPVRNEFGQEDVSSKELTPIVEGRDLIGPAKLGAKAR